MIYDSLSLTFFTQLIQIQIERDVGILPLTSFPPYAVASEEISNRRKYEVEIELNVTLKTTSDGFSYPSSDSLLTPFSLPVSPLPLPPQPPLPPGITLRADVYRPVGRKKDETFPVLLLRTPYDKSLPPPSSPIPFASGASAWVKVNIFVWRLLFFFIFLTDDYFYVIL